MTIIKDKLQHAPQNPGIYIMLSAENEALYVGKAKNIRNRLEQYIDPKNYRIQTMISKVSDVRFITTKTEEEALMLEMSNIKSMKPKYNFLLKDDKTFPEIFISTKQEFPLIRKHRGKHIEDGEYFGPFGSSDDVDKTINLIKKFFNIRGCKDGDFNTRTRPCLEYQIKRCTAPCVNYVTKEEYSKQVKAAIKFLKGKTAEIQEELSNLMSDYAENMEFEKAAEIRDKITSISKIQMSDNIQIMPQDDMDVIGIAQDDRVICLHVFFIRNGYNCGNRPYFIDKDEDISEILYQFIYQFYTTNQAPKDVYLSGDVGYSESLSKILNTNINKLRDGRINKIIEFANSNAENSLKIRESQKGITADVMEQIAITFKLEIIPKRIEVFDNSHTFGTNAVGAMIVATTAGFEKSSYRKFNFDLSVNKMDDYAMMYDMLHRRALKIRQFLDAGENEKMPDLWLIDGGVGHVGVARQALLDAGIHIPFICISKGEQRNAGNELFHTVDNTHIQIDRKSDLIYYLQRIRDEVHRFAISSHKHKRDKDALKSALDEIPGIGTKRKQALLKHFGSPSLVKQAQISELVKVDGISNSVAEMIHNFFNPK